MTARGFRLTGADSGVSSRWALAIVAVLLLGFTAPAGAQVAAHFLFAQSEIGPQAQAPPVSGATGVAVDLEHNVYISQQVWDATASAYVNSIIRVPASDPTCQAAGDCPEVPLQGDTAWDGAIGNPNQLATDIQGNLYIAAGKAVVFVPAAMARGTTTVACSLGGNLAGCTTIGGSFADATGVAVDANGNVYVADQGTETVWKLPANDLTCGQHTCGAIASNYPTYSVAVDALGNVYTAPPANASQSFLFTPQPDGSYQASLLADLTSTLATNQWMSVGPDGSVYVSVDAEVTKLTPGANGYSASATPLVSQNDDACLVRPEQSAFDSDGDLYLSDANTAGACSDVDEFHLAVNNLGAVAVGGHSSSVALVFAFDSPTAGGHIGAPTVVTQGTTNLDFLDTGTGTCDTNGSDFAYSFGQAGADSCTVDVQFTPSRPGLREGAVNLVDPSGQFLASANLSGTGMGPQAIFSPHKPYVLVAGTAFGPFRWPYGLATDAAGNLFVSDEEADVVFEVSKTGALLQEVDPKGFLFKPAGLALGPGGDLYVADTHDNEIQKATHGSTSPAYSPLNTFSFVEGYPMSVAVDRAGNVFVANGSSKVLVIPPYNPGCAIVYGSCRYLTNPLADTQYGNSSITGVAVGDNGNVYLADNGTRQVVKVNSAGASFYGTLTGGTLVADHEHNGIGQADSLANDFRVTVDGGGNVLILDVGNDRIVRVAAGVFGDYGSQTVLADASDGLYLWDGGDIAVDGDGNVYYSDIADNGEGYYRVSRLGQADPPPLALVAGGIGAMASATVTVTNAGNADLQFPPPPSGPGSSQNPNLTEGFTFDGASTCPIIGTGDSAGKLAAGSSCTYVIDYTPATGAPLSGALTLTENSLNAVTTVTSNLAGSVTSGIVVTPALLSDATVGGVYNQPLGASGGTGPYTFTVTGGALPNGMTLSPAGLLSGTPSTAGDYSFTVTAVDAQTLQTAQRYDLTVNPGTPTINWPAPGAITQGTALSAAQLNASAGTPGTFVYNPPVGTMLEAGVHTLGVMFTPEDTDDYLPAYASVALTVNPPAHPVVHLAVTLAPPLTTDANGNYVASLQVTNSGNAAANAARLTLAALLVNNNGLTTTPAASPLPLSLGDLAPGGAATVVVTFPASAGPSGAIAALRTAIAYTGGSAAATLRAMLP